MVQKIENQLILHKKIEKVILPKKIEEALKQIFKDGFEKKEYTIVSFNEADPLSGLISNESPLGVAFIGRKKGDKVAVETPRGLMNYKIVKVD